MPDMQYLNPLCPSSPNRLSAATCALAQTYLAGGFQQRLQPCGFSLNDLGLPMGTPPETLHGKLTLLTAQKSRIDLLPEELLAGNAPNIEAIYHRIPGYLLPGGESEGARYAGLCASISHTTPDFADAVRLGLSGLERQIRGFRESADGARRRFYDALLDTIAAMRIWTRRCREGCRQLLAESADAGPWVERLRGVVARLEHVPENPPRTFAEAVQSLWSFFEFQRLCGNWPGIGRIDWFLGPYLEADLANGTITLDDARDILAHFWIKGTEWCSGLLAANKRKLNIGSGDAQNYQNIILGGIAPDGSQVENAVTFLVLDIVEELHISDYPVTVRLNEHTSERLLRRIADVQLLGGGIVSVYSEPVILRGLARLGIAEAEARRFTNDGCWEILIPGQTNFTYYPMDILQPFQKALFAEVCPANYDELYREFLRHFQEQVETSRQGIAGELVPGKEEHGPGFWPDDYEHADAVLSLLMPSCRESGCSYTLHGTRYVMRGLHVAGLPDVVNSLYAIRELVFRRQVAALPELVAILKDDWRRAETLRLQFANSLRYYGNDNPEVDSLFRQVFDDCTDILWQKPKVGYIMAVPGVSTFGREIEFASNRLATAFGKHAHEYLAPNLSPTPGTDRSPLTAVLNSYCQMDFSRTPNGCPLDLRLSAGIRQAPDAAGLLAQCLRVFLAKEGMYLQIDTVDPEMLRAAQREPDRFPNLVVRISGWSARFASLNREWQDMIINRTALELA